ncbi:MAG: hypothetical protein IJM04_10220 [Prevotella sp.]|nr:hypothetical protein [Prevotella sp.]
MFGSIADWGLLITAIITIIYTHQEFMGYKEKEYNKLLSQLNKRYVSNKDVQDVVQYLRIVDPENKVPSTYQLELFLRFFEELGLYLKTKSIKVTDVDSFFGFYLKQLYTSDKGKILLKKLKDDNEWENLKVCKEKLGITL